MITTKECGQAALGGFTAEVRFGDLPGRIGRIRIVEHLGSGAMGKVYRGVDETLRRPVAVKILKHRLPKGSLRRARLLREAQVVSQLRHPGICQVYDFIEGDEFDYLVLELIEGKTLGQVMARRLDVAEALQVAQQIARALAAAHRRGIVHRDLKPSNVMLTPDGRSALGRVKVLDFGIARLIDPDSPPGDDLPPASELPETLSEPPALTGTTTGTPQYMSPEQAAGSGATPASDMFAFGLLLQEMVTGRPAFDPDLPADELLRKVRSGQVESRRGLTRELDELCGRLQAVSPAVRPVAADTVERLRWIERQPRRRVRRIAYVGLTLSLLVLAGVMGLLASRLRTEVGRANREASTAREVSEFLVELFDISDPWETEASTVTARELLDRGAGKIRYELADQPRTRARLLDTMGNVYRGLGLFDEAKTLLEEALELRRQNDRPESPEVAASLAHLGLLFVSRGEYDRAEPLIRQAAELQRKLLGPDHPDLAETLSALGRLHYFKGHHEQAETLLREALEIRRRIFGERSREVAGCLDDLSHIRREQGDFEMAEELCRRALEIREEILPPEHPDLAFSYENQALLLWLQGRYAEAEPLFRRDLEITENALGPNHPDLAGSLNNLAMLYLEMGEYRRAEPYALRSIRIREVALGPDDPELARDLHNFATLYDHVGDFKRAEEIYLQSLGMSRRTLGADHPAIAVSLNNLGKIYLKKGDLGRAEPLLLEAVAILEKLPKTLNLAVALNNLARLYVEQGEGDRAERTYRRSLNLTEELLAERPENSRASRYRAVALIGIGKVSEARGEMPKALASWTEAANALAPVTASSESVGYLKDHATALLLLGRVAEARPLVEKLPAESWIDPWLREPCRRYGLL